MADETVLREAQAQTAAPAAAAPAAPAPEAQAAPATDEAGRVLKPGYVTRKQNPALGPEWEVADPTQIDQGHTFE